MKYLLVRHLESDKNINAKFASDENSEGLTHKGLTEGEYLSLCIEIYLKEYKLNLKNIYCADSSRAIDTAKIIASRTQSEIVPYDNLNSIRHHSFSGLPETEIEKIDPEFIYQLKLYRLGLLNSYKIKQNKQNEKVKDFEKRVVKSLDEILNNNVEENIKIIILHRSSILATLFHFVRIYYDFPKDFYGYVQIDVGHICLFEINNKKLIITAVNQTPGYLNE